jgi:hypothetical protein
LMCESTSFSTNALNSLNLSKHSLLALSGYIHIFLEKSSMKVKKYLAPPKDMFFMGPHTLECTISNTLVACVAHPLEMSAYVAFPKCSPHIQWIGNHHAIWEAQVHLPS